MDNFVIPSIVCDENKCKKDAEIFAVLYDFLKNREKHYIVSQYRFFIVGVILMVVGVVLITLLYIGIFTYFLNMLTFPNRHIVLILLFAALIVIGAALFTIFFVRKPKFITIKKIYYPFLVDSLSSEVSADAVVMDPTGKLWNLATEYKDVNTQNLERDVKSLPTSITTHREEVDALNTLRDINENLTHNIKITVNLPPTDFFKKVINFGETTNILPKYVVPVEDYDAVKLQTGEISENLNRAQNNIELIQQMKESINSLVDGYIQHIESLKQYEREYMLTYMAKFVDEVINAPDFFNPLIRDFREDIRDYQLMIKRIGDKEIADIKNRVKMDLREMERIVDEGMRRIEGDIQNLSKKVGRGGRERIRNLLVNIHEIRESIIREINLAKNMLSKKEGFFEEEMEEKAIKEMILWWGSRERVEKRVEFVKNEHRIYDMVTESIKRNVDLLWKDIANTLRSLKIPQDRLHEGIRIMKQKIFNVIERGRREVEKISREFEADYARIMRNVTYLEGIKGYVEDLIGSSEKFLEEELYRHIKPFEERVESFDTERTRINRMFDIITASDKRFIDKILKRTFKTESTGVYHIPYWIISYGKGGKIIRAVYTISELEGSTLIPKFKEINVDEDRFLKIIPPEFSEGIDRDLLVDIKKSAEAYRNTYGLGFVDKLSVVVGVSKIAR